MNKLAKITITIYIALALLEIFWGIENIIYNRPVSSQFLGIADISIALWIFLAVAHYYRSQVLEKRLRIYQKLVEKYAELVEKMIKFWNSKKRKASKKRSKKKTV